MHPFDVVSHSVVPVWIRIRPYPKHETVIILGIRPQLTFLSINLNPLCCQRPLNRAIETPPSTPDKDRLPEIGSDTHGVGQIRGYASQLRLRCGQIRAYSLPTMALFVTVPKSTATEEPLSMDLPGNFSSRACLALQCERDSELLNGFAPVMHHSPMCRSFSLSLIL